MNFLLRSFLGLIILSITLGFLILGRSLIEALKKDLKSKIGGFKRKSFCSKY